MTPMLDQSVRQLRTHQRGFVVEVFDDAACLVEWDDGTRAKYAASAQGVLIALGPVPEPDVVADPVVEDTGVHAPYDGYPKTDLATECDARDLPRSGTKDALMTRLQDDDAARSEADDV